MRKKTKDCFERIDEKEIIIQQLKEENMRLKEKIRELEEMLREWDYSRTRW